MQVIDIITQVIAFISAVIVLYYADTGINQMKQCTNNSIRLFFITSALCSTAVIFQVGVGIVVDYLVILLLCSTGLFLHADRRRDHEDCSNKKGAKPNLHNGRVNC